GALDTNSFAPRVEFDVPGHCHIIALGDLNGDGKVDIAMVTELNSALSLYQNLSEPGSFTSASLAPRVDYATGYNAWGVAIGDLDGDGRPDIAFGNAYDTSMWVYQNGGGGGTSNLPPVITHQPGNQTVSAGGTAQFSVTATGSPTLFYQWYFGSSTNRILVTTRPTLTLSNVQPGNAGSYFVVVSNAFGSAISSRALLTVIGETNSGDCTPPPRGLVAWWRAENNADDSVGGNNGTINGAVGFRAGEVGQAFNFTNGENGVLVPASPSLNVQSFTIEAWINPTDVSDFHPILEYGADTGLAPVQFLYGWNDPAGTTPGALFGILRATNGMNLIINS